MSSTSNSSNSVLDELDRNQKKENYLDMYNFQDVGHIGSGPGVHV